MAENIDTWKKHLGEAMVVGELVDLRSRDAEDDAPANGNNWGPERTIPAPALVDLLTRAQGTQSRALRLAGGRITGAFDLEAAELSCPVLLDGCWFDEAVTLAEASLPSLRLPGCHLPSLNAEQLAVRGNLELNKGFTAHGEVNLLGAHIGGQFRLSGATLTNPNNAALVADGIVVDGSMLCRNLSAQGRIDLLGAYIGGQLSFNGATLINLDEVALVADKITVNASMFFQDGFTTDGGLRLISAHIGGQLSFRGATLRNPRGITVQLQELRARSLFLRKLVERPESIELVGAEVRAYVDDADSWPHRIELDEFQYDILYEEPIVSADQRLAWIRCGESGYRPQPYEQLAAVYRRSGRDQDARTIAIAKQRARRRTLTWPGKLWSLILDGLVGYGYRTWQAGLWLLGFVLAGWLIFDLAFPAHLVAPKPPSERPLFHSGLYALDLLLPIGDLNYQGAWIARGWARGFWLAWILAGWVLTTAVLAALAGILRRD